MGCLVDPNTDDISLEETRRYEHYYLIIDYNKLKDINFKRRLYNENLKLAPLLKAKIDELIEKRNKSKPVEVAHSLDCNKACYEYHPSLVTKCPKCGGKVEESYENGCTIQKKYDAFGYEINAKVYDNNICEEFLYDDRKISKEDYDLKEFFNYFRKTEKLEGEDFREYMIIDGERFDAPTSISLEIFFKLNDLEWFPQNKIPGHDWTNTSFFIEGNRDELGKALGFYGYRWQHFVFVYRCLLCGLEYHIMRTSPFRFRDKTKDNKITVIKQVTQENQENQEKQEKQVNK